MSHQFKLSEDFIKEYEGKQPNWGYGALGYVTYKRTYSRTLENGKTEEFWQTLVRVINGVFNTQKEHCETLNLIWDNRRAQKSAQIMFKKMWEFKFLPPGRGLWGMGTDALKIKGSAMLQNCGFVSTGEINHDFATPFCWAMDMLFLGVGVGYDLLGSNKITIKAPVFIDYEHEVRDTREGWIRALRFVLEGYEQGTEIPKFNYSKIRPIGAPIKTFGGTSSGAEPLKLLLHSVMNLLGQRIGEKITSTDILDIMNFIGRCAVAGNVRRSAELALGQPDDLSFLDAKNPLVSAKEMLSHRWASNNSIAADIGMNYTKVANLTTKNGEPGYVWLGNTRAFSRMKDEADFKDANILGFNPCLPKWSLVLTPNGISTLENVNVGDEIWSGQKWTKIVRKWSTGIKEVNAYKTTGGIFYGTKNHRIVSNGIKIEVERADSIDTSIGPDVKIDTYNKIAILDGLLVGDGMVHKASNNLPLICIGQNDSDYHSSEISSLIGQKRPGISDNVWEVNQNTYIPILKTYERSVPDKYKFGSLIDKVSFLRGLYSANGSVVRDRVTLKAASFKIIEDVQVMLSSIGIKSYYTTNQEQDVLFSNGTYTCKESYDLNITSHRNKFKNLIGFIQKYKNNKLQAKQRGCKYITKGKNTFDIKNVEYISTEEVFDIEVDAVEHTFWCNGMLVSNCAEQPLENFELCNLVEVFPHKHDTVEEFYDTLKYAYMYAKTVTLIPTHEPRTNAVLLRNRRIGCSLSGIEQAKQKFGISTFYKKFCDEGYKVIKNWDKVYSNWLCIPRSIKVTTVKPSGTVSLLVGATAGIHAAHAEYYYRTIRLAYNSPLVKILLDAGYRIEYDAIGWKNNFYIPAGYSTNKYNFTVKETDWKDFIKEKPLINGDEKLHNGIGPITNYEGSVVAYFPIKEDNFTKGKDHQSIWEQMDNAAQMQYYWSDNGVSATINFKPEEAKDIQTVLEHYESRLKAISFLPLKDHGYEQAPYITISKDEYDKAVQNLKSINFSALSSIDKKQDNFCDGDRCEIRS